MANISLENNSPQFTIPRVVYAIMNQVFEIRIQAEDVDGEEIVYALLTNGTLITAQITEKGLLTLSNVTENGTVYIQAKDKSGAQNILILRVNAIHCPCEHSGRCHQRADVRYPIQPNNYFCQCEEPYTGQHCEVLQNPCDDQPCYPGLKCSLTQNSKAFTCEDCPPLFEGDGKHCELKRTPGQQNINISPCAIAPPPLTSLSLFLSKRLCIVLVIGCIVIVDMGYS